MVQFTESAKKLIQDTLASEECDTLKMFLHKSCCGTALQIDMVNAKDGVQTMMVDGIQVSMDKETEKWTENKVFDTKRGRLTLLNMGGCCCC
jgi:Fe-S cluster assembly iron-binding protein IscA